ncbi:MAG: hypothetical protein ABJD11_18500 [Gemmatimonadota bacterium]
MLGTSNTRWRLAAVLGTLLLAGGCTDAVAPGIRPALKSAKHLSINSSSPTILQLDPGAPPLFNNGVSFWAKVGAQRSGKIYFQKKSGGPGKVYAELQVDGNSLRARPDGTPFVAGDSVLITMTVLSMTDILFEFAPSGLTFNSTNPATLVLDYSGAGADLNKDGVVDDEDQAIEQQLGIYRQATPGAPFVRIMSIRSMTKKKLMADVGGFSRYAIAY